MIGLASILIKILSFNIYLMQCYAMRIKFTNLEAKTQIKAKYISNEDIIL